MSSLTYQQLKESRAVIADERDELVNALRQLLAFTVGLREDRDGNPYLKPSVVRALKVLHTADGYTADDYINASIR